MPGNQYAYEKKVYLKKLITIWARWWVRQYNTKLDWIDTNMEKEREFKEDPPIIHKEQKTNDFKRVYGKKLFLEKLPSIEIKKSSLSQEFIPAKDKIRQVVTDGNITYKAKVAYTKQNSTTVALSIAAELKVSGGHPPFIGVELSVSGSASKEKSQSETNLEEDEIDISNVKITTDETLLVKETIELLEYEQHFKISGEVVVSCTNKINPGLEYTNDTDRNHKFYKWAIPIARIIADLNTHKDQMDDDAYSSLSTLSNFEIKDTDVIFKHSCIEEKSRSYVQEKILNKHVKEKFDIQFDKLKTAYEKLNQKRQVKRLFDSQFPVSRCTDLNLLLVDDQNNTQEIELKYIVEDLIKNRNQSSYIVYGDPGIGKTTLLDMLVDKLTFVKKDAPFKWIFQISLKNLDIKNYKDGKIQTYKIVNQECFPESTFQEITYLKQIERTIFEDNKEIKDQLNYTIFEILKNGEAFLILDGYDEMPRDDAIFKNNVKAFLNLPFVLVTSRPHTTSKF